MLWVAVILSIWVSIAIGVLVLRSEARKLVQQVRLTDPIVTEHTALISGYGGLGRYLLIRLNGAPEDVLETCPGLIEDAICMRVE